MGATASTQQKNLTSSQFHEALGELTEQLRGLELPPEAQAILSSIDEMNTQERQAKRSHFSMVPSAFWAICKEQGVSLAAQAVWLYVNEHGDRQTLRYRKSQRRLSDALGVVRETLDKYLEELAKAGLLQYNVSPRGTSMTLTDLWSENAERAVRKALMKNSMLASVPSQDPPSPPPSVGRSPLLSDVSDSSFSSSLPEGGQEKPSSGKESLPPSGQKSLPQNKISLRQDLSSPEEDQIRSDPPQRNMLEERTQRYLALAQSKLVSLESYYTNQVRLSEALKQEQHAAAFLAKHILLAQEDESVFLWLLEYIQSEQCGWYVRFRKSYPDVPVQLKHLLMPGFLKECMREYEKVRAQLEYEHYVESLSRHSIEAWERQNQDRHDAPNWESKNAPASQQSQSDQIDTTLQNVATHVTKTEGKGQGGDMDGHTENPYTKIVGIGPRLAVYFLREIRQHNPEWEPRLHWAAPGTQVIDVVAEGQPWYFIEWGDYNNLRTTHGLPVLPLPISMTPSIISYQPERARHVATLEHNRRYIAKCKALKA